MLDISDARRRRARRAEPYTIPENCPRLADEPRERGRLTFDRRAGWMAEWLLMAQGAVDDERDYAWRE